MLKRVMLAVAALVFAAPALAGDPVPGIGIALDLNAAGPRGERVVAINIDRTRFRGGDDVAAQLSENIGEVLAQGEVRANESETAAVSRRVVSLASGEASPTRVEECFRAWCANIQVHGQQRAETTPVRR